MFNKLFKLHDVSHVMLISWITKVILFASLLLLFVMAIYFYEFRNNPISSNSSDWGTFGDYFGGTLNPIFGFLTLLTLSLTIAIQSKQLEVSTQELKLSRNELELTRTELARSASAQEESQKALNVQAEVASKSSKLNTISFLLDKYHKQLNQYSGMPAKNTPQFELIKELKERCSYLENLIEEAFNDLIKANGENNE